MKGRNCPNCGAPLDSNATKCAYCGTSYFDMSAINLVDSEPFYIKIKHHISGKPVVITALVRANPNLTFTMHEDYSDHVYECGEEYVCIPAYRSVGFDMNFYTVNTPSKETIKIEFEEETK